MSRLRTEAELRLQHVLGLSPERAARAVAEVLDCFDVDVGTYVRARHDELQAEGTPNAEIYEQIARELQALRFRAEPLTARQIRRRIYG
ncbi:MAG: hypothetical protein QM778_30670 [Myxococcales bacterium]